MLRYTLLAGAAALTIGAGVAYAQVPTPPGDGQARPMEERGGMEHEGMMRDGMMHGGMRMMHPMSKAAFFMLRKGDARIAIKCADDEPMKACVDAASALLQAAK